MHKHRHSSLAIISEPLFSVTHPGGTQRKIGWGCAVRFSKLKLFMTKICDFLYPVPYQKLDTLFMTWSFTQYRVLDSSQLVTLSRPRYGKRVLFMGLLIMIKMELLIKITNPFQDRCKNYPFSWPKSMLYLRTKWLKNHTLWGPTYLFSKFSAPTIAFLAFWLAKKLRLWANSRSFTSYGK